MRVRIQCGHLYRTDMDTTIQKSEPIALKVVIHHVHVPSLPEIVLFHHNTGGFICLTSTLT